MKLYYLFLAVILSFMPLSATAKNQILKNKISQYVRQIGKNEVYDISSGLPRDVSFEEAQKNNIWNRIKEVPESPITTTSEEYLYDKPAMQRAYDIWKTRTDLQKEFPNFYQESTPSKWSMKDWYNKYGKNEYSDLNKNFYGLNIKGKEKDDWSKTLPQSFSYNWGSEVGGYYQPGNDEIYYNNSLPLEVKRNVVNHEIGHYLTKNNTQKELDDLFKDEGATEELPVSLLKERAAVAYAGYRNGNVRDKRWIKFFRNLEEKSYKLSK